MADVLYFNGRFTTTDERVLGVEDRGFQFGDAVYEVFKFRDRRAVFLLDHFRRMERGLAELEIRNPFTPESFTAMASELLERTSFNEGIVYVQISRGEAPRAHFWPEDIQPTVVAYSRAFRFPDAAKKERGIRTITVPDPRWQRCDIKSVNLLGNAMAKKRAQRADADEVLLLNGDRVREGASASFFAVHDGTLITHPRDEHILPGVVRDHVMRIAQTAGIPIDERPLRVDELSRIVEAFITSTTQGVMPVTMIDGRPVGEGVRGALTLKLQTLLDDAER